MIRLRKDPLGYHITEEDDDGMIIGTTFVPLADWAQLSSKVELDYDLRHANRNTMVDLLTAHAIVLEDH
jgi:hypothetical protein